MGARQLSSFRFDSFHQEVETTVSISSELVVGHVVEHGVNCYSGAITMMGVNNKKYKFVLDSAWNEEREEWLEFKARLKMGTKGCKR